MKEIYLNIYDHKKRLSKKQQRIIATKPDVIWQFVQRIKKEYQDKGQEVEIYASFSKININGKGYVDFIDPKVDLASVQWELFSHSEWILPSNSEEKK